MSEESMPKVELPKFDVPQPDKNCKFCHGTGRIGYEYDPKSSKDGDKKLGKPIPCPKYQKKIQLALKKYLESLTEEQKYQLARKDEDPKTLEEAKELVDKKEADEILA